jgi:hypothetical protein
MKHLILAVLFLTITTTAHAQVYKWVDENGTTHFSDKPHSGKASEIDVPLNGVTYRGPLNQRQNDQARTITTTTTTYTKKLQAPAQQKIITADDYKITTSVGKLGNDVMSVSGRVGNGPTCKDMRISAYARNENGLSARVSVKTKLSSSSGSTIFQGSKKVNGSAADRSFWKVESVSVHCYD